MQTEKRFLTIREAASYMGMSVAFLRKAVRRQRVPHTRIGTSPLRFDRNALDAWLAAQGCGAKWLTAKAKAVRVSDATAPKVNPEADCAGRRVPGPVYSASFTAAMRRM